jgi:GH15 family glucan-1,4-alpha-glucosidase
LMRVVVGLRGRVSMCMELIIRFGYGSAVPWVSRLPDGALTAVVGPNRVVLRTPVPVKGEGLKTTARFDVKADETVPFVFTYSASHLSIPDAIDASEALESTEVFWREWADQCSVTGVWSEAVVRSLITLKALTYAPTGGIVAAPTTSLPECLGGERNWDYRYCWLRDATLTLLALMDANYFAEAEAWRQWLQRAIAGSPAQAQIMYGIAGERRLSEWTADWLPGYEGSKPVRIGNAAADQLQIDVYGEVMDALHQARKGGLPSDDETWALQRAMLEHLESVWQEPDEGIWEMRGGRRHFTHSKVMAWVAFDRGIKGIQEFGLDGPLQRWQALRSRIHDDVCRNGYDDALGSFVRTYGSKALDASLLLIPLTGFLPVEDARVRSTIAAIERDLVVDGLLLRYRTETSGDGLPPGEAPFLACSFWLADAYVLQGRHTEARALFERLLALRNDVGLYSEEYDVENNRFVGNFPQAFSHVGLIDTACNLTEAQSPAKQRVDDASQDLKAR